MHMLTNDVQDLGNVATQNEQSLIVARDENESLLTAERAKELFYVEGGLLLNRVLRGRRGMPGMVAGSPDGFGYLRVKVDKCEVSRTSNHLADHLWSLAHRADRPHQRCEG